MAIGGFRSLRSRLAQDRSSRRAAVRQVLLEALESRQLMAIGPQLIGVQPNSAALLEGGEILQVSPRELVFRFDDAVGLDAATLSGIRVIRSGADGLFERAAVATDFGTNGQTLVEFYAQQVGEAGNGIKLDFSRASRTDSRLPRVTVNGRTVNIELNSNPQLQTRVQDLLQVFRQDGSSAASQLVYALRLRGSDTIAIASTADVNSDLVLAGAGAAKASTDFGLGSGVSVQFLARDPGNAGVGTRITVTSRDRAGAASPIVTVSGKNISVEVNSNSLFPTTLQEFINAINATGSPASNLVEAKLISGLGTTKIGRLPLTYSPITLGGVNETEIVPGYIGFGDSDREVVLRFAERLQQSHYRIDILGQGLRALKNVNGQAFNDGISRSILFGLNTAARVESIVPQPVTRSASGLVQQRNQIDIYFNDDALIDVNEIATVNGLTPSALQASRSPLFIQNSDTIVLKSGGTLVPSVLDSNFYQLIHTNETLDTRDDLVFKPSAVRYYPDAGRVSLIYNRNLDELQHPTTSVLLPAADLRLRVGTNESAPLPPIQINALANDAGDRFDNASNLAGQWSPGAAGSQSVLIDSLVRNVAPYVLDFPGGSDEPGNRQNRYQDNLRLGADTVDGPSTFYYNFQRELGTIFGSTTIQSVNAITEQQKTRVREVFALYERYLGVRFVETQNLGFTVGVGDMRAVVPFEDVIGSGAVGVQAINQPGGHYYKSGTLTNGQPGTVLDAQDFSTPSANVYGGNFQRAAMQAVGRLLGLGMADEVEGFTVMSYSGAVIPGVGTDIVLPGDVDIVHGQFLYRPDSKDIDLYQFSLPVAGRISIETFAQRMSEASLLDTTVRLYQQNSNGGWDEIAANDDYYGYDSLVQLDLEQGNYIVGVSAAGNDKYDPMISDSGLGGRSDGRYQLRMDFRPPAQGVLRDGTGKAFDGNSSGDSGGVFNFWFRPSGPGNTKFVDKMASTSGNGSVQSPFRNINSALAAAVSGDVVRIVGNPGADGSMTTLADNLAYEIGFNNLGQPLPDGATLDVPRGVSVMVDAGAILKMKRSRIGVGSSTPSVDQSGGSLLVLGTPKLTTPDGLVIRDANNQPVAGSVYFTSAGDSTLGKSANVSVVGTNPVAGDWGGIDFRNRVDQNDATRINNEAQGQFLNWVSHADLRYGGGQVVVGGVSQVVTPIQIVDSRPSVGNSVITRSADVAVSATPDSFRESNFHSPSEQNGAATPFSVDYDRVGPAIYFNRIVDNAVNGMQIKTRTLPVSQLEYMSIPGRFDDTDIVHYLSENLVIAGNPGGPTLVNETVSTTLVGLSSLALGTLPAGSYRYRFTRVVDGVEQMASEPTRQIALTAPGSVVLNNIPVGVNRVYRSASSGGGPYTLVANLNGNTASYTDTGTNLVTTLTESAAKFKSRPNARLKIDAGTVVKSQSALIEAAMGGQVIAEGADGNPVVFTSIRDNSRGAGGTFKSVAGSQSVGQGDWSGVFVGPTSKGSLDHTVITFGGGTSKVDGGFSDFNAIEVHQGDLRVTNSRLEQNASGSVTTSDPLRAGHNWNSPATVFVRGAQPIIADNIIQDNAGPAISANVNALNHQIIVDNGRSSGRLDRVDQVGNRGPLVVNNRLDNNAINGMVVRGGVLTTEGVWDDTDIVHVVQDEIIASDHNHHSGLRLTSKHGQSLVVKLKGAQAGFTAKGLPLDNVNRIGGSIQLVGLPNFPVILTSLDDNSVGAGFKPDGTPQRDSVPVRDVDALLPTGPEVNNGLLIDNDVPQTIPGYFSYEVGAGGDSDFGGRGGITAQGNTRLLVDSNVVFGHTNYVDVGGDGQAVRLASTTITTQPTLVSADLVVSEGNFQGAGGTVNWRVETWMENGIGRLNNRVILSSATPLGNIRFINYLDEDVEGVTDDLMYTTGTPGQSDFRVFTLDGPQRVGFNHGGFYSSTQGFLENASYLGWAADEFPRLQSVITGTGTQYTLAGNINTTNLVPFVDGELGNVYGLADVTTAFAWDVEATATRSVVTSFLELVSRNPTTAAAAGDWRSLRFDTNSNDRNVAVITENESTGSLAAGNNNTTFTAQHLGIIAVNEKSGDENSRLGFHVRGSISRPNDIDVYSFKAVAGTEVWLDIDGTDSSLDTVVELVDANGGILALSSDSLAEEANPDLLYRDAGMSPRGVNPLRKGPLEFGLKSAQGVSKDLNSTNPWDAGMRVILPGNPGDDSLYHVRVRSSSLKAGDPVSDLLAPGSLAQGRTKGSYTLQVRLRETDEVPGSSVNYADIRFGSTGIELRGVPGNSPLIGENVSAESNAAGQSNNTFANAQPLGNLLQTNRQAMSIGGVLDTNTDVDWFSFDIQYDRINLNDIRKYFSTVFDVDYADAIGRPDVSLYVFDSSGNLILAGLGSALVDDQANPLVAASSSNLAQGSSGPKDAFIGPVELPAGRYFLAITNDNMAPAIMDAYTNPTSLFSTIRMEPGIPITQDRLSSSPTSPLFTLNNSPNLQVNAVPFQLQDVSLYVSRAGLGGLKVINPFTGQEITTVSSLPSQDTFTGDLVMRSDGRLFMVEGIRGPDFPATENKVGRLVEIDPNTGALTEVGQDGIPDFDPDVNPPDIQQITSNRFGAATYQRLGFDLVENRPVYRLYYAVDGERTRPFATDVSTLYRANPDNGSAAFVENEPWGVRGAIYDQVPGDIGRTTGIATLDLETTGDENLYGVSDLGYFYQIDAFTGRAVNKVLVGSNFQFSGLTVGPQHAEGGRLARTFFATTTDGRLVSLNTQGQLQPVFANGATEVTINVGGLGGTENFFSVSGLAFSPLDFNLWHPTNRRADDASRGVNSSGLSMNFGLESWSQRGQAQYVQYESAVVSPLGSQHGLRAIFHRDLTTNPAIGDNYSLPAGAAGVLESHPFSLANVNAGDRPTLYFNYFSATDGDNDRLKVFGAGKDGQWILLASNHSSAGSFSPPVTGNPDTQQLLNNTDGWRQARVPLDLLAGESSIKLRFEFSTSGSLGYGDFGGKGPEIRTIPGDQLLDGQRLVIGGQSFEIEMGMSLVLPGGSVLSNGDNVTVNGVQYVFHDGTQSPPAPAVSVIFNTTQTAEQIAESLLTAIAANSPGVTPLRFENRIQLVGAATATVGAGAISIDGAAGSADTPILVGVNQTAAQVALSLQSTLANRFAGGVTTAYPIRGNDIIALTGQSAALGFDPGPFGGAASFTGGGSYNSLSRGLDNDFEGVYLDDFLIGLAGRGEVVLGNTSGNTDFIPEPQQFVSSPPRIKPSILQGPYQVEIRGGADMGTPTLSGISMDPSRQLKVIDRMAQGFSIQFRHSKDLIAGDTFTVSDGITTVTFELDDVNDQQAVQSGRVALPFNTNVFDINSGSHRAETAQVIAGRFRDLINSSLIQSMLTGVSANLLNNDFSGPTSDTVVIFGGSEVEVPASIGTRIDHRERGGSNRERLQGQVVVNATRISHSANFGASVLSGNRDASGVPNQGSVRNTVTINEQRLVPGAVIMNSEFLFNGQGGINIAGDAGVAGSSAAAVPYVRLVNNTILGGSISTVGDLVPVIHGGFVFDIGNLAFADQVSSYNPGSPAPIAGLSVPSAAIGPPNYAGGGEPRENEGAVSLGRGGSIAIQFSNNFLTGSDSSDPDLMIFEVGNSEDVRVDVSSDGVTWTNVGTASASSPAIDIDPFGFSSVSRLAFVRLTDIITQGAQSGDSVGADIDAVGALSSVPREQFVPGGTGIAVVNNASATLLNNVIVNHSVGVNVDASSSSTVLGGNVYQSNASNAAGPVGVGQFPLVVGNTVPLFVSPATGNLLPAKRSPLIDVAIDSIPDRAGLVSVKGPLGIPASPILAPRFDLNGQLRVADPFSSGSTGTGESGFKDRGSQDRSDTLGPSVLLVQPADNDVAGLDTNSATSLVELVGVTLYSFDLRLVDGLEANLITPGTGINHETVTSAAILIYRNNIPLVEGVDYRFGYDSTNGVIRLQPIAGIWQPQGAYTIKFVNDSVGAVTARTGQEYGDGEQFEILDASGRLVKFEFDTGIVLTIPSSNGTSATLTDASTFLIDDGTRRITFELDNDNTSSPQNQAVVLPPDATLAEATDAILAAIGSTSLQVVASRIRDGRLQVQGSSLVQFLTQTSALTSTGRAGVQGEFGLQIPTEAGVPVGIQDGQQFIIEREGVPVTFELDTDGNVQNGNRPVLIVNNATADQIGAALVSSIQGAGLGLTPSYLGNGLVRIGGGASVRIVLTNTVLRQTGIAGQPAAIAIPVPINATAQQMAQAITQAIESSGLSGLKLTSFGSRLVIEGAAGVSGTGAGLIGAIRDLAGNPLKANQEDGSTELTIFMGEGADYGDAPSPHSSLHADNGPRHKVAPGLSLGPTVTTDVDARLSNLDQDDGVTVGNLFKAFQSSTQIQVNNSTGDQAFVSLWIDFDGDGFFSETEKVADALAVSAGTTTVSFLVPTNAVMGPTYARARISTDAAAVSSPLGAAADGEVEDWAVEVKSNPFTNANWNLDVNASGRVSSIDALQVINWLNDTTKPKDLSLATPTFAPPYVDVNGDGRVTSFDALLVINYLNERPPTGGEGEMSDPVASSSAENVSLSGSLAAQQVVMPNQWVSSLFSQPVNQNEAASVQLGTAHDLALTNLNPQQIPVTQWPASASGVDQLWASVGAGNTGDPLDAALEDDLLDDLLG